MASQRILEKLRKANEQRINHYCNDPVQAFDLAQRHVFDVIKIRESITYPDPDTVKLLKKIENDAIVIYRVLLNANPKHVVPSAVSPTDPSTVTAVDRESCDEPRPSEAAQATDGPASQEMVQNIFKGLNLRLEHMEREYAVHEERLQSLERVATSR